jgi:UDP-N-acetylmuramate--alanine ligase
MHIFFSGIGGTAIGPLALIAQQAGHTVSGSDKQDSNYIHYLREHGIEDIHIGQSHENIAEVHARQPIDWLVYSSAVAIEQPDAPEFVFCREQGIRMSQRDELLNAILQEKHLKLIAVAGTHGKTTTTAMMIWLIGQLGVPVSYSVGAKISFGDMGHYEPDSEYFVYEADEFARNFLAFHPHLAIITGIDWDHPDIYPTREDYNHAFRQFLGQTERTIMWQADADVLQVAADETRTILDQHSADIDEKLRLPGHVNRLNAWEVARAGAQLFDADTSKVLAILDAFPGVSRRFEQLAPHLYTDYSHTPPKIRGALQLAHEVAADNVVVVYEGLHNTRQHFIKDELAHLFDSVKNLYIVPSYLAREDPNLALLSPEDLKQLLSPEAQAKTSAMQLNPQLKEVIGRHRAAGDLVLCLSAGGGHSLDEWLRKEFSS